MKKVILLFFFLASTLQILAQEVLQGDITTDKTLTADKTYLLRDIVRVQAPATLTIEAGTIIYGENSTKGTLLIKPGAKINALGTVNKPIVFTSEFNKIGSTQSPTYGDWAGIILLGNAPINVPGGTSTIEGPGDSYGGTNADDNSGVMKYVRIEFPGIAYSLNNEVNGLTFGGVGRGTTIEHIQVSYSGDDSYEWFGGNVNCKYLVAYRGWDDDFDTDYGFQGKLQFLVGIRDPQIADQSSSNGFESDNDGTGSTNAPRTSPTWYNVTLVGPEKTIGDAYNSLYKRGMHLRRSSQNKVANTIIMGWPTGLYLDGTNVINDANSGVMYVKNSIIAGSSKKSVDTTKSNGTFSPADWFTTNGGRVLATTSDVLLTDAFNYNAPNFLPKAGSPALTGGATPPNDGFFDVNATYVGAFGTQDWTLGWTKFNLISTPEILQGDITTDLTLTSDKTYTLVDIVRVQAPATLTIQAGTIIYGDNSSKGTLVVKPGAKIIADGNASNPIVFTSQFTKPESTQEPTYGDWGGIILLGNAPINVPGGTSTIEGPGDSYGGTNADDNSGILRYVRIEYPGIAYSLNNEVNGLTFGGVGRGTTIEHIQVSYSGDDSYEWFGGNVNCKYLIAYRGWDDDFDTDYGFQGKLQFLVGLRDPEIADQSSSNGFESDNDGTGSTNDPRTSPTWYNVTLVGPQHSTSAVYNSLYKRGMHLRRSSQNKIANTIITGWPTGIYLDGTNVISDAGSGVMFAKNSIIAGSSKKSLDTTKSNGVFDPNGWFSTNNGRVFGTTNEVMLTDAFNLETPNFLPIVGSPALIGGAIPPSDGFFDVTATFVGAFGTEDWTKGWAKFSGLTSVKISENINVTPSNFEISQNYPNPFNPSTSIKFSIPEAANVKLTIFNILGQEISTLINEYMNAGSYTANWTANNLPSGIYIYRMESGPFSISKKMTLLK
ncbi:MAG: T9SS type A sorting domain-containing protein [bacterium]